MSDMSPDATADAFIAARGLASTVKRAPALRDRAAAPPVLWRGEIPLQDMPLVTRTDEAPAGYVLVADDPRLPPVLEHSEAGESFTAGLCEAVARAYPQATIERLIFQSSLQIAAEVSSGGRRYMIELPTLRSWEIVGSPEAAPGDVAEPFDRATMDGLRQELLSTDRAPLADKKILTNAMPVKYNQNCNRYSLAGGGPALGAGTTHCSPNSISGCAPVGWAMWVSALKRVGFKGGEAIWRNSTDWQKDWPSFGAGQISQSAEVNSFIWKAHRAMGTTTDGFTRNDKLADGGAPLKALGVPWKFRQTYKPLYELAVNLVSTGLPFLFGGTGRWHGSTEPKVGHCVVVYGYNKASNMVLVCKGWGSDAMAQDKFINWDQLTDTTSIHLTS